MKNVFRAALALSMFGAVAMVSVGCGGGPCADLEKKKADCASNKDASAKEMCEKGIDAAVKADNADACKAMLDNLAKK